MMNGELVDKLRETLLHHWGHKEFRPMQLETIMSICAGRDTLALMPTGAGKSLIYQLPTIATDGFCVVVTPLIALMKDQVDKLRQRGVSAVAVHSGMTPAQIDIALDNCVYGDVKFLYVAPERVASEVFRLRLPRMNPTLIAVDEAHCISQWGYDFRPSYLRIAELRAILPDVPFLAVTASATDEVAEDIMTQLKFSEGVLLRSPFARPNLSYSVRKVENKNQQLMRIINNVPGAGIVYVRTREGVEQLAATLTDAGVAATFYHGGMEAAERTIRQEEWITGRKRVMVATNAFGMGIDKADVRFVVHYSICDSVENYYQETGRAGRDGRKAYGVLLTSPDDRNRAQNRFVTEYPSLDQIKNVYESIFQYLQVGVGEGRDYSFDFNIYEFCRAYRLFTWTAANAIKILQYNGYLTLTDESDHPARVMFRVGRDDLYRLRVERDDLDHFLRVLLRMYNGLFTEFRSVSEQEIATVSGYTVERVKEFFKTLWQLRVIKYIPSRRTPLIYFPSERLPIEDVYIAPVTYKIRKDLAAQRSEQMFAYAENTTECRSAWIQRYFGESELHDCGVCDICLERKRANPLSVTPEAIVQLLRAGGKSVKQVVANFEASPEEVIEVIDKLIADGKISVSGSGILRINS
jgi:ATP-dependent DNA helicase RecQ